MTDSAETSFDGGRECAFDIVRKDVVFWLLLKLHMTFNVADLYNDECRTLLLVISLS